MKAHETLYTTINLRLFDGEGGGSAPAGEASPAAAKPGKNPLADVRYGKQAEQEPAQEPQPAEAQKSPEVSVTTQAQEARKAEFERLIKGEYKDLFDERAQQMIDTRFKQTKTLEAQAKALEPMLEMLASKYGVDGSDVNALSKAIQEDDSYYEEEAMKKGLTVEQLKHMKRIERENAEFRRAAEEQQRRANRERVHAEWQEQSEACRRMYPGFDFRSECEHPETGQRFARLLGSGVDVKTAFEVVHKDDLIGGAMQYTAQAIQQKTVNDIRARGMRPSENGGSGSSAATIVKSDPKTFTKKDRDEIARRVMRGERIEL